MGSSNCYRTKIVYWPHGPDAEGNGMKHAERIEIENTTMVLFQTSEGQQLRVWLNDAGFIEAKYGAMYLKDLTK